MRRRRGAVIIVVLVIVMMVSLAAYHFTLAMESEHLAARNLGDQVTGRHCALSGVELLAAILEQPRDRRDSLSQIADFPIDLWPTESNGESPYRVIISFPGASASRWMDESGKLNLHQLLQWDQKSPGLAREALLRLPNMDEATADLLLDWIDTDLESRPQGDEKGARNSIPLLVDELAFLQFPGSDRDRSDFGDQSDQLEQGTWLDQLTVHSAERNESFDGDPRIFLNTPDLVSLHRQLSEVLSSNVADYIVLFRQYGPSQGQTTNSSGSESSESEQIDFSVAASAEITDLTELIDSVVTIPQEETEGEENPPKTVSSPISLRTSASGSSAGGGQPIDEVFDYLTLTKEKRLPGRINILNASAEVLAAIPGVDESLAEQIVRRRDNIDGSFKHPIGLLSSLSLDLTMVKEVIPHMTVAGDVVRAEFVGSANEDSLEHVRSDRPTYRCEVILDASDGRSRQAVFRRLSNAVSPDDLDNETGPAPVPNARL
jgi:hypothetical protein